MAQPISNLFTPSKTSLSGYNWNQQPAQPSKPVPNILGGLVGGVKNYLSQPPAPQKPLSLSAFPSLNATGYPTGAPSFGSLMTPRPLSGLAQPAAPATQNTTPGFMNLNPLKGPMFPGMNFTPTTQQTSTTKGAIQPASSAPQGQNAVAGSLFTTPNGTQVDASGNVNGVPGTAAQAPAQQPQQQTRGLFPSVVGSLAGTGPTPFNPYDNPLTQSGVQDAAQLRDQLRSSIRNETNDLNQNRLNPIPLGDQTGRDANIRANYQAQQAELASSLGYDTSLINAGLTGSGQKLTGLTTAGSLTSPQANFPFVFDPSTGTFSAPGTGGQGGGSTGSSPSLTYNPATDSKSLAQAVMNHQISYNDAISALSYGSNGSNAAGQLSSAILAAGGNPTILQTQAGIQSDQEQQKQAYNSAHQQALNLQTQLSDLISTMGLNPSDLTAANAAIQVIAKNTSDPRYQILNNYLADVASRYSQILTPPGGSATDTTRAVATGMLNAVASGKSIMDVMNSLDQQAQAVISGVSTIGGNSSGQTSGTVNGTNQSAGGGVVQTKVGAINTNW